MLPKADYLRVFLCKIMTLKEYLEREGIKATPDQRSKIGCFISKKSEYKVKVIEDRWEVNDYQESFLREEYVIDTIIKILNSQ